MHRIFHIFVIGFALLLPIKTSAQPSDLMIAVQSGDFDQVSALLASGTEPDPNGIATPLYFAAQSGHLDIVDILLEYKADPNTQSNWGTPLQIAAQRGHVEIVRSLLENGANQNMKGGEFENTPLHEAANRGFVEIGQLLIKYGVDVNIRNAKFEPPIHLAVLKNRTAFTKLLQDAGAVAIKVESITKNLKTADLEKGRISAIGCAHCHWLGQTREGGDAYGPQLWNIVGRQIAVAEQRQRFPYSEAMKREQGVWTFERLNSFLADPSGTIPGQLMYKGRVEDRAVRVNLIAYLRTLSDDPVSLP